ncbi:WhiB family transcriptional regulator [Mycolicibacterium septicum]|uniref:WhiB family transcriptional regulator n=1 Tax=Mycolicibacterium septicum TaxID=98668 RepID=UPI001AF43AA7|nr:WhiB family transcriptional regulator [Mycolicibacterium septicum]QRY51817.1 WhiB family transcriptional regulator [Mycolicibacterium septicum]
MKTIDRNWRDNAACFYLPEDEKEYFHSDTDWGKARKICRTCPVIEECLLDAVRTEPVGEDRYGVRGGMCAETRMKKFG